MPPKAANKQTRPSKSFDSKSKMAALLGLDVWLGGWLVKPLWDLFEARFLDTPLSQPSRKIPDFTDVCDQITSGEGHGKRRYLKEKSNPQYDNALDWYAWLMFWLVNANELDHKGCFFGRRKSRDDMRKDVYYFIIWAKRKHHRDVKAVAAGKTQRRTAKQPVTPSEESEDESEDEIDMDPTKGTAAVRWRYGLSYELEMLVSRDRILVEGFCGYSPEGFTTEVKTRFELGLHGQQLGALVAHNGVGFRAAQLRTLETGEPILIFFDTLSSDVKLPDDVQRVTISGISCT
ncbi:hypothetical protein CC86DRAFT_6647 [Ophiobolus disseminans]|uniref:Uncharacterized protein n=1 Tax=Ophiobolus disseminans TaxID=1469910 RepID=A0A6A7AKL8_9PLEO|nr:hypothetical protein CC86DRAFT_6647 [Ophiobolus disseminans]